MSKITKDQAKDLRNAFQCWQQDYDPVEDKEQYDMFGLGMVAMDALLASLEPVSVIKIDHESSLIKHVKRVVRETNAPPAQVSVPDDVMAAIQKVARIRLDLNDFDGDKRGILDCLSDAEEALIEVVNRRAAMLQGAEPVSNRDELPDGWVACSERMPDDEEDVLCFGQYGDNDIDEERYQFMGWLSSKGIKRVWRVSDGDSQNRRARVTHWMPLPAAPQREGENV